MKNRVISKNVMAWIVALALLLGAGIMLLFSSVNNSNVNERVYAAETIQGSSVTWAYDSTSHTLTLGGSGNMPSEFGVGVGIYERPWESIKDDIRIVVFGDNVTSITAAAFDQCFNLQEVSFNGVTSIGNRAFRYCTSLKRVNYSEDGYCVIPSNVNLVDYYAFADSTLINKVVILGDNTTITYHDGLECGPFFADSDEEGFFESELLSQCKIYVADADDYNEYYAEKDNETYGNGWAEYFSRNLVQSGVPTGFVMPSSGGPGAQTGVVADVLIPSLSVVCLVVAIVFVSKKSKKETY